MNRRTLVTRTAATLIVVPNALLIPRAASAAASRSPMASLSDAMAWLDKLDKSPTAKTTAGWPLAQVLEHLAQSIEFSMSGFPQAKPAWFQATAGKAAFALFSWRGRMWHSLQEPIPGAPPLRLSTVPEGIATLRKAIAAFEAHKGALEPHFAYGNLSRADYTRAHAMHIDNHLDEIAA